MSKYGSYRGRRKPVTAFKVFLLVVLIIAALFVASFSFLQRYIVYTAGGVEFDLPFLRKPEETEAPLQPTAEPELIVTTPEVTDKPAETGTPAEIGVLRAHIVPQSALFHPPELDYFTKAYETTGANALILEMKAESGKLSYPSVLHAAKVTGAASQDAPVPERIRELKEKGVYLIAEVSCFRDSTVVKSYAGMALLMKSGQPWPDYRNNNWLNPFDEEAKLYLVNVAKELAGLGFDEILLRDVQFPINGWTQSIHYGEFASASKTDAISAFSAEIAEAMAALGVRVSILVDDDLLQGPNANSGQDLDALAPNVDRVLVMTASGEEAHLAALSGRVVEAVGSLPKSQHPFVPVLSKEPKTAEFGWAIIG